MSPKKSSKKRKVGRPRSVMTPEVANKIIDTVRLGIWPDRAAQVHGIAAATMRAHRARDPEFATAIATAEAQAEALYHSKVLRGADRHWNAAAWMLERRWGERWGKRDPVAEVNLNVEKIQTTGPILPKDQQLAGYLNSLMTAAATLGILSNAADQSDTSGT